MAPGAVSGRGDLQQGRGSVCGPVNRQPRRQEPKLNALVPGAGRYKPWIRFAKRRHCQTGPKAGLPGGPPAPAHARLNFKHTIHPPAQRGTRQAPWAPCRRARLRPACRSPPAAAPRSGAASATAAGGRPGRPPPVLCALPGRCGACRVVGVVLAAVALVARPAQRGAAIFDQRQRLTRAPQSPAAPPQPASQRQQQQRRAQAGRSQPGKPARFEPLQGKPRSVVDMRPAALL